MDIRVVIPPLPSPDGDLVGAIIDSAGFDSRVVYTIACSCRADADAPLYGFMLEESDEPESNLNTVDPDDFIDHEPSLTTTARSAKVEYTGGKRYTRLTVVPLGKGGLAVTAMALLG